MLEKVKPVLDTSYKPYISDGNKEDDKEPQFYQTNEEQLVVKKVAAFYTKVTMPCVVPNANESIPTTKKPAQKRIPNIKRIILLKLLQELGDYKVAVALVGVDPKYASKTFQKFTNTGHVLAAEKSLCVSTIFLNIKSLFQIDWGKMGDASWAHPNCVFLPCSLRSTNGQSASGSPGTAILNWQIYRPWSNLLLGSRPQFPSIIIWSREL
ncbi:hypothetical protein DSO57_1027350 [Entomophthora muscae]|uniref:Uncharacterized protein n=1 Tax=Entomophthora muscae TaxID=34485 RepID=A0ACC2SQQ5_9FUNG|nr:hypothetical protein DSO57_1027350 [Entomophthora muscae]